MRRRLPVFALAGWTVVVWGGRIRNVLADDDLSGVGFAWRLAVAVVFVVLAVGSFVSTRVVAALVVLTTGWWAIRGVGILLDPDHGVRFKLVHTVLMVVSIGLAMWAWLRRDG